MVQSQGKRDLRCKAYTPTRLQHICYITILRLKHLPSLTHLKLSLSSEARQKISHCSEDWRRPCRRWEDRPLRASATGLAGPGHPALRGAIRLEGMRQGSPRHRQQGEKNPSAPADTAAIGGRRRFQFRK